MNSLQRAVARKAVRSTAKHTAKGTIAKATRKPMRAATLFGAGCAVGGLAGAWLGGRTNPAH